MTAIDTFLRACRKKEDWMKEQTMTTEGPKACWLPIYELPSNVCRVILCIENSNGERKTEVASVDTDEGDLHYWSRAQDEGDIIWIPVLWLPWPETPAKVPNYEEVKYAR